MNNTNSQILGHIAGLLEAWGDTPTPVQLGRLLELLQVLDPVFIIGMMNECASAKMLLVKIADMTEGRG